MDHYPCKRRECFDALFVRRDDSPILLYDGSCTLCTKSVQFIIQRDSKKRFRFASLQSTFADSYLGTTVSLQERLASMILVIENRVYRQSTAALLTARRLDGFWPLLTIFLLFPTSIRDPIYRWLAKHRYRILGGQDSCWTPTPEFADRFLDQHSENTEKYTP